ncbi:choline sulfate utilization transcriptional regulator [Pseudorhizobium pelagicum]|uniref:HTH-type transcriptional regulator TtuA n=1 Tax=Pseudorhizobium pelagicum TaxID=1509405 RepID=A0A922P136_9HYPH|nr:LysR family transcriptional regulator [Pseudorhizobium pelagicum]KEQ03538.1 LysR family transcriptional regulator [Pseudorhizobium pelagicum]KEQ03881.1 LysR family transcriptional regulator [Pseudorhizobium pelagicum]
MSHLPVDIGWMRLFVEIAREGSLSAAARVQGLSQPAVSYQIRQLEASFGRPLLHRQHRGVSLTEEGKRLLAIAEKTVSDVDALAEDLRAEVKRPALRLCTDYAFATLWLIPRMHSFRQLYPDFDIQIVSTQRLESDWAEEAEIAVAFGSRAQFGHAGEMIMPERVVPVCSQAFLQAEETSLLSLSRAPLIHLDTALSSPWFDWASYFAAMEIRREAEPLGGDVSFNNYAMVVQAALGGQGMALGWLGLVDSMAASGMLVTAGPELSDMDRGYWVLAPRSQDRNIDRLTEWLKTEAAASPPL